MLESGTQAKSREILGEPPFEVKIFKWDTMLPQDRERILKRSQADLERIRGDVAQIISDVRQNGEEALLKYTRDFDNPDFQLSQLKVTDQDIERAYHRVNREVVTTIREQIEISSTYAKKEKDSITMDWRIETIPGVITGLRLTSIESVGLYVPATKAPLPVVAQILAVTAKAAEVSRIVVCFPPTGDHSEIIISAIEAGADEIYRMGGVQAIAGLAYGTKSIKPVKFIAGPGNRYVQAAKLQVFGQVGIDMLSGPSEALILADESANPAYLAADILARCEHGEDSAGVLITNSEEIAKMTAQEVKKQAPLLGRKEYIGQALTQYSAIIIMNSLDEMIEFTNEYSPEHLEVQVKSPQDLLPKLHNAGSIFLGEFAPVAVGDYASGTNHCLPTGAAAKFASPVGVRMFLKASSYQQLTKEGLKKLAPIVEKLSDVEGLDAHKRSVQIRF